MAGWFSRLKAGLSRSSGSLTAKIASVVAKRRLDDATLEELEEALIAADRAFQIVRQWPGERFARFLEAYADRVEANAGKLIEAAHLETALPVEPRLKVAELPRTINQLRQAAAAAV